jgi:zinc transport system ATP-binding protein
MHLAIETAGLSVTLGGFVALDALDLALAEGEFLAVIGPNGAGKSTLLRVLLGLQKPSAGLVRLLGQAPERVARGSIGYVPQLKTLDRSFPALSCEVVISGKLQRWPFFSSRERHAQAEAALAQVGAAHLVHRPLSVLSGGELQRVYLARALVRQPRLILLDEPAAGIDRPGEEDMHHVLEDYRRRSGATVVMVTHDWGAAYHHASRVLILNQRAIAYGEPREALTDANLRHAFGHSGHAHAMSWEARDE